MSASLRLVCVFFLLSAAVCGVLNPGNFGAIDTTRRLQVARWIRLGEPPVRADDVDFGISGRNGVRHAWYGVGQSLVLVPFDAAVSAALSSVAPRLGLDPVKQRQLAKLLIAFLMQTSITFAVLLLARLVLLSFGFSSLVSTAGALALLFGTTFLYYVQCAQENNLLLLLALVGLLAIRRWQQQPRAVWPWIAGAASGFAVLVRLTSLLEAVVLLAFALQSGHHARRFLKGFVPPMTLALFADRWYNWHRFGELWSTYATKIDRQHLPPTAPVDFPFGYPFNDGFFGALFSPSKSVFLFDPLLLVLILSLALQWRGAGRDLRRLLGWIAALLVLYAGLYATYYDWGGDVAWGDRFLTVPVHLLCLFAVPLLLAAGGSPRRHLRHLAWCLVLAALVLQAMSTTLLANLEVHQRENGFGESVILNRTINLAQIISGQQDELRFAGEPARWRTFNYLPFQLSFRFPGLAGWAAAEWGLLLISLPWLGWLALRIGAQAGLGEA